MIITGSPWAVLIVLLGSTIGIFMGLLFPTTVLLKLLYVVGLTLSLFSLIVGFKNHNKSVGQFFAVVGIVSWCLFGTMGLGTGT